MGLKILHSADWHLDSPFGGFPEDQRQELKKALGTIPGKIADLCRREGCDLVLLAGDIFDGSPSRETLDILKEALARCAVPVFLSPGNHDFCGPGSPWLEEVWPENVHIFTGGLTSVAVPELNCRVWGAGYQSMDCLPLLEGFRAAGEEAFQIGVLHGDPTQKRSPYNPITAAQVRDSGLNYLALGHIHKAGAFPAGDTLCAWPGCPMGRGWDETGEKGVCVVTLGETPQLRAVSLDTPKFYEWEAEVGESPEEVLAALLPAAGGADHYRITLQGWGPVDLPALKEKFGAFLYLELIDRTESLEDLWTSADRDSLEGVYFGMLRQAMASDPENAHTIRLAAELSRKLLTGKEVRL